jgi:hypothetical protein
MRQAFGLKAGVADNDHELAISFALVQRIRSRRFAPSRGGNRYTVQHRNPGGWLTCWLGTVHRSAFILASTC